MALSGIMYLNRLRKRHCYYLDLFFICMLYLRSFRVSCLQLPFLTPLYTTSSFERISANNYHQLSQRTPRSSDARQVSIHSKKPDTFLALISQSF
jgi:hypothetical protein